MPIKLSEECIGKKCVISLMTGSEVFTGIVREIENYWLKIEEEDGLRIINGVGIRDIKILV